jgi:hypothetical protein
MEENGLPTSYRDQIAEYIVQNTGLRIPVDTSSNPDPFTGGGAYVPGSSAPQPGQFQSSGTPSVTGGGVDPFTGCPQASHALTRVLESPVRSTISVGVASTGGRTRLVC